MNVIFDFSHLVYYSSKMHGTIYPIYVGSQMQFDSLWRNSNGVKLW